MKLKYYLRGLAVGIIATTIILLITFQGQKSLSNHQIIQRAQKLGMVMSDETSKSTGEKIPQSTEKSDETKSNTQATEKEKTTEATPDSTTQASSENKSNAATSDKQTTSPSATQQDTKQQDAVSIQIQSGDSSDKVAESLYKAGVVDSAAKFNAYMVKQGFDRKLKTGTYSVSKGMTYEQIMSHLLKK